MQRSSVRVTHTLQPSVSHRVRHLLHEPSSASGRSLRCSTLLHIRLSGGFSNSYNCSLNVSVTCSPTEEKNEVQRSQKLQFPVRPLGAHNFKSKTEKTCLLSGKKHFLSLIFQWTVYETLWDELLQNWWKTSWGWELNIMKESGCSEFRRTNGPSSYVSLSSLVFNNLLFSFTDIWLILSCFQDTCRCLTPAARPPGNWFVQVVRTNPLTPKFILNLPSCWAAHDPHAHTHLRFHCCACQVFNPLTCFKNWV